MHKILSLWLGITLANIPIASIAQAPLQPGVTTRNEVIKRYGQPDHSLKGVQYWVDYYKTNFSQCWRYNYQASSLILVSYFASPCPSDVRN